MVREANRKVRTSNNLEEKAIHGFGDALEPNPSLL